EGWAQVVVRDQSPFGAGWWLKDWHQLVLNDQGALLVYGTGESRFFQKRGDGFVSPAEDFGTLAVSGGGYVYRSKHGDQWFFGGTGLTRRLERVVARHGLTQWYSYDENGQLHEIESIDGGRASFTFGEGEVTIAERGSRYLTLSRGTTPEGVVVLDSLDDVD